MNTLVFPIVVTAVLGLAGLGLGFLLSRAVIGRRSRLLTLIVLAVALLPWFQHHRLILAHEIVPLGAMVTGPIVVAAMAVGALFPKGWWRLLIALVPGLAFCVSWYLTIPMMAAALPRYEQVLYDNIPSIWLAIWTMGATVFLLAYAWPFSQPKSTDRNAIE